MQIPTSNKNNNDDQIKNINTIKTNKNCVLNIINNNVNNENAKSKSISKLYVNNFTGEKSNDISAYKSNKSTNKYYLKTNLPTVTISNKNLNSIKHKPSDNLIKRYNIVPVELPFIGLREDKEML